MLVLRMTQGRWTALYVLLDFLHERILNYADNQQGRDTVHVGAAISILRREKCKSIELGSARFG
jgi:hypothetical protein